MIECKHYDREEIDLNINERILRCKDCGERLMTEWGNFWITCKTCGNKRHTGTDFNARLIKETHEHNHKGHKCEIKNENLM